MTSRNRQYTSPKTGEKNLSDILKRIVVNGLACLVTGLILAINAGLLRISGLDTHWSITAVLGIAFAMNFVSLCLNGYLYWSARKTVTEMRSKQRSTECC